MSCRTLLKSGRYLVPVRKILIRVFYTFGQYHSLGNLPLCVLDPNKVEYANIIHLLKHLHLIESPNDLDKLCHLDGPRIVLKSSILLHFRPIHILCDYCSTSILSNQTKGTPIFTHTMKNHDWLLDLPNLTKKLICPPCHTSWRPIEVSLQESPMQSCLWRAWTPGREGFSFFSSF